MDSTLTLSEFKLFKKYIADICGIDISEEKSYLIETRLSNILADSGLKNFEELYNYLRLKNDDKYKNRIIEAITTNETLWFREKSPWKVIEKQLLPQYIKDLRNKKKNKIRIWSAAASTGQEAFSTAMCIANYLKDNNINDIKLNQFEILATDISETAIEIAKAGRYDAISIMRGLEPSYKKQFFNKDGFVWELDQKIVKSVNFQKFNLQENFDNYNKFDIIFCRYVLIYFTNNLKENILYKLTKVIEDLGTLFLGSAEIYQNIEKHFKMENIGNGVYYRKKVNYK